MINNWAYSAPYLLIMVSAFLISYSLTPLISKFASGRKQLSVSSGGISIYLAFVSSLIIFIFWLRPAYWANGQFREATFDPIYGILIGGALILFSSLFHEYKRLSFLVVLLAQVVSALILIIFGVGITISHLSLPANVFLTICWVVLVINAFGALNPMAGLREGIAIIATIPLFIIGWRNMDVPVIFACCVLASVTFGFLRFSFPPSRISLGKAGSMFLGFVIAACAMAVNYTKRDVSEGNLIAFLIAPLLILAIPLYDTVIKLLKKKLATTRIKKQLAPLETKFLRGFAQYLIDIGFSTRETLFVTYFVGFILSVLAVLVTYSSLTWAITISFWVGAAFIGLIYQLNQSSTKALNGYVCEIKKSVFGGGLDEPKEAKGYSRIRNILKSDLQLVSRLFTDIILINMGIYSGYLIRFNGVIDPKAFQPYLHLWYVLTAVHLAIFAIFKLYYPSSRFSKIELMLRSIKAVTLSAMASICIVYMYRFTEGTFPFLVFISAWFVNIILVGGWRVFIRYDHSCLTIEKA